MNTLLLLAFLAVNSLWWNQNVSAEEPNTFDLQVSIIFNEFKKDAFDADLKLRMKIPKGLGKLMTKNGSAMTSLFHRKLRTLRINRDYFHQVLHHDRDALHFLICHELGHVFGGKPYAPASRLSLEGQADYWAAQVCMPRLLRKGLIVSEEMNLFESERQLCDKSFELNEDRGVCKKTIYSGRKLFQAFLDDKLIGEQHYVIDVSTPSQQITKKTLITHPEYQCRLDTVVHAILASERPSCWFRLER